MLFTISIIAVVAAVIVIKGPVAFHLKELKAAQFAQEYLAQKYEQEMQYDRVWYSWIDPGLYHVVFLSANTNITFQVQMWPGVFDSPERITDDNYIWDNYLENFFCSKTEEAILPDAKKIWGENVNIGVVLVANYPSKGAEVLNEHMTAIEMEPFYNYEILIDTNQQFSNESKMEEADRILDTIRYIQASQYQPREILFWYQANEGLKKGLLDEPKTRFFIWFGDGTKDFWGTANWLEATRTEDILKAMDEQRGYWFEE